jgi:hypothetical protein
MNHTHLAVLPRGAQPDWCGACRATGAQPCAACWGAGTQRSLLGFSVDDV